LAVKSDAPITVGRLQGVYGVKGWFKVYSYTEPRENILKYTHWLIRLNGGQWQDFRLDQGRLHGKGVVAHLGTIDDRDQAAALLGAEVAVHRNQLAPLAKDEYYWTDLIGLTVVNLQNQQLGKVTSLLETGANDVLVVQGEGESLIPWAIPDIVKSVDLQTGTIAVDWQAEE
jgi:16S rRNA processing protein RimM